MQLEELRRDFMREELLVGKDYGRVLSIVDFGNVNYWFNKDRQDADGKNLSDDQKLSISLEGLKSFSDIFSEDVRVYYGLDYQNPGSIGFISATKRIFGKNRVISKQIQFIRHHLSATEAGANTRALFRDAEGDFVRIPKCNFDVEMVVDAIRLIDTYDTLAMFSSDADFVALFRFLKKEGKKIILIKGGNITDKLRKASDLVISAQKIKRHIAKVESRRAI